jgi:hypothetical protein
MEGIILGNIRAKVPHAKVLTIKCDLKDHHPQQPPTIEVDHNEHTEALGSLNNTL